MQTGSKAGGVAMEVRDRAFVLLLGLLGLLAAVLVLLLVAGIDRRGSDEGLRVAMVASWFAGLLTALAGTLRHARRLRTAPAFVVGGLLAGGGPGVPGREPALAPLAPRRRRPGQAPLEVALQPVVGLGGTFAGAEALARFADGRPPEAWLAEAHGRGTGLDLELEAARSALRAGAELPGDTFLAVNASPALLLDQRFEEAVRSAPVAPSRLVVEITEHAAVTGYDDLQEALLPLRARGVRLAVDDTGAGYASFAHVLRLRPEVVKLDRSLVAHIDGDRARRALVVAIVQLASGLEATVTAEGVETAAELAALAAAGVDHVQGYLVAPPTTDVDDWRAWGSTDWAAALAVPR